MGRKNETAEVDVEVLVVKDGALYVSDGDTQAWVPKSLIDDDSDITKDSKVGDSGTLILPQWKAEELGLV